jgi:uncharacterized damage-inducible protein DinB
MKETERIADQLLRAFRGEAWHGPSVLEVIADIRASQAAARPLNEAHSIWELVLHIAAWESACLRRLQGDPAQLSAAEDWPSVNDITEEGWQRTIETLKQGNAELRLAILGVKTRVWINLSLPVDCRYTTLYMASFSMIYITLDRLRY